MNPSKPLKFPLAVRLAAVWLFLMSTGTGAFAIWAGSYGRWVGRSGWVEFSGPQATWAGCMAIAAGALPLALLMRTRRQALYWAALCVTAVAFFGVTLVRST